MKELNDALKMGKEAADLYDFAGTLTQRETYLAHKLAQLLLLKVVEFGAKKGDPEKDMKAALMCVVYDLFEFERLDDHAQVNPFDRTLQTMARIGAHLDAMNGKENKDE